MRDSSPQVVGWAEPTLAVGKALYLTIVAILMLVSVWACSGRRSNRAATNDADQAAESTSHSEAQGDDPHVRPKVLLVHSYHTGYPWADGITRGLRMSLSGSNIDLQIFYMDTKRQTDEAWMVEAGRRAREVVTEWQPDVVIAADDNAQRYFVTTFADDSDAPQFVFCGVNAEPTEYGYPASNVTGILERPHFEASFDMLADIQPGVKRIALITDNSPTSAGVITHLRSLELDYEIVAIDAPATFAAWQDAVLRRSAMADALAVFNYHTVQDGEGTQRVTPSEVMRWTVDNCDIPIIGFQVFTVDDGALCGYLESAAEHGKRAGDMTQRILRGTPAGDIPLVTALEGQSMLNLITARRLGIHVPEEIIDQIEVIIRE